MADRQSPTKSPDAGAALDSSPSSSLARGLFAVPDAKPKTVHSDGEALLDTLLTTEIRSRGPRCAVERVLHQMSEEHRTKFTILMDKTDRPASQIAEVANALGYDVSTSSILRHRNRLRGAGCKCKI